MINLGEFTMNKILVLFFVLFSFPAFAGHNNTRFWSPLHRSCESIEESIGVSQAGPYMCSEPELTYWIMSGSQKMDTVENTVARYCGRYAQGNLDAQKKCIAASHVKRPAIEKFSIQTKDISIQGSAWAGKQTQDYYWENHVDVIFKGQVNHYFLAEPVTGIVKGQKVTFEGVIKTFAPATGNGLQVGPERFELGY